VIDGLALVDKPAGMTSHDVVARCRKLFGQKRVGHAGTLDPDATGLLVVGLGRATRLLQFMSGLTKSYVAEVVLGVATSTLDAAGEVTGRWDQSAVTLEQAREAATRLTGTIWQVPPMVSAVKVGGKRLHQLARSGVEVEREARQVTVTRFSVDPVGPVDPASAVTQGGPGPVFAVAVDCSSGTYVRVLAADLGTALGGGAHVRALRRTAVGPWLVGSAVPLDALGPADVLPPADALPWLEPVSVDAPLAVDIGHGRVLERSALAADGDGPWRVIGPDGELLAVYADHRAGQVKPVVVVAPAG
jgi:tRNA pseudouridine55 synthase